MRAEQAVRAALPGHPLARHIDDFLTDLTNANKPRNTIRAYRGDLTAFAAHHDGDIAGLTAAPVRAFLGEIAGQAPATRKRKRAAVASFCKWAVRHELLDASPMDRIDTIEVPRTLPRPAATADVAAVLDAICSRRPRKDVPVEVLRDRVLFETAYVCGARASEVCGMYVEDLDLRLDDEHARLHGKGGTVRTVLLDDRGYVALLRLYLARSGYTSGPLLRASINGRGGPLSYDAAHHRWKKYCAAVGAGIGIHQLRHAHATELINNGVSIEVVRRRLGTPPPRPPRSTPCSPTRSPTPKSALPAGAVAMQRADGPRGRITPFLPKVPLTTRRDPGAECCQRGGCSRWRCRFARRAIRLDPGAAGTGARPVAGAAGPPRGQLPAGPRGRPAWRSRADAAPVAGGLPYERAGRAGAQAPLGQGNPADAARAAAADRGPGAAPTAAHHRHRAPPGRRGGPRPGMGGAGLRRGLRRGDEHRPGDGHPRT